MEDMCVKKFQKAFTASTCIKGLKETSLSAVIHLVFPVQPNGIISPLFDISRVFRKSIPCIK